MKGRPIYTIQLIILLCSSAAFAQNDTLSFADNFTFSQNNLISGIYRAVCYSGFRSGQHPDRGNGAINPTYKEILEDLKILERADFNLVRLYDCQENSQMVLQVIKENNLNIKVLLGVWLKAEVSNHEHCWWLKEPIPDSVLKQNEILNLEEIERSIKLANKYPDIIVAVNIGNEALVEWNDHMVKEEKVISYVKKVKDAIKQGVTVADNFKWWVLHGEELAKVVDFISIHVYPLWEGQDIDNGLAFSLNNFKEVYDKFPDHKIAITEAGWATVASEFGDRANEAKQKIYFEGLMKWAKENHVTTFFFEAFDEDWKGDENNALGAEKHWGLYTVDRKPKKAMKNLNTIEN